MNDLPQPEQEGRANLARQDDPDGIAALLNRKLEEQGITVTVTWHQNRLNIALEGEDRPPDERELVDFIAEAIAKLQVDPIQTIEVCGRVRGEEQPAWRQTLVGAFPETPVERESTALQQAFATWLSASAEISPLTAGETSEIATDKRQEFLRFRLAAKEAALLPLNCIKEVLKLSLAEVLPVPHMSDRVLGVYNWRGEMLWLIDLNRLLGFPALTLPDRRSRSHAAALSPDLDRKKGSAIVVQWNNKTLGLVVQQVYDLERHSLQNLQPATSGLFSPQLLPFASGYLTAAEGIVLDPQAIVQATGQG